MTHKHLGTLRIVLVLFRELCRCISACVEMLPVTVLTASRPRHHHHASSIPPQQSKEGSQQEKQTKQNHNNRNEQWEHQSRQRNGTFMERGISLSEYHIAGPSGAEPSLAELS